MGAHLGLGLSGYISIILCTFCGLHGRSILASGSGDLFDYLLCVSTFDTPVALAGSTALHALMAAHDDRSNESRVLQSRSRAWHTENYGI